MLKFSLRLSLACAFAPFLSVPAQATTLISNYTGGPDGVGSTVAGSGDLNKAAGFTIGSGSNYILNSVTLRLDISNAARTLAVRLYAGSRSNPNNIILDTFFSPVFSSGVGDYTFQSLGSYLLQQNTTYWLSVSKGNDGGPDEIRWLEGSPQATPTGLATSAGYRFGTDGPPATGSSSVFNTYRVDVSAATGAVPEPATWAMMMIGFGMVGYSLRRKAALRFV